MTSKVTSHRAAFRYHPRFGYFFRPNLRLWQLPQHERAPLYLISTNSLGARCYREPETNIDGRGIKILFIGDSLAVGDNVSNRERFTDVLEQLLPGAESHNYGLSGSGHDQQLLIHREFSPLIDPDVLVLCPAIGCIGRNLLTDRLHYDPMTGGAIRVPRPYFTLDTDGSLVSHNVPVPKPALKTFPDPRFEATRPNWQRRIKDAIKSMILRQEPPYLYHIYDDPQATGYRLGQALLREILRESAASLKVLAPLPDFSYVTRPDAINHHSFFSSVAEAGGAHFIDVSRFFQQLSEREKKQGFFPHDAHYTRSGHEVIATGLAATLRALGDWPD